MSARLHSWLSVGLRWGVPLGVCIAYLCLHTRGIEFYWFGFRLLQDEPLSIQTLALFALAFFLLPLGVHFLVSRVPAACPECQSKAAYREVDGERPSYHTGSDRRDRGSAWASSGSLLPIVYVCANCGNREPMGHDLLV